MISPFFKKKDSPVKQPEAQVAVPELEEESVILSEEEIAHFAAGKEEASPVVTSFNKTNMDKRSLDLVFAVEQVIQARQQAERSIHELQDRLTHSSGHVDRLNREVKALNQVISDREKNVLELERKLTDKNLKVDQAMEDYRELQSTLNGEIEELKNAIELEQQKYGSLLQKHNEALADKVKAINEYEDKLNRLEVENTHLKQKYEAMREEKTYLANMISDFTSRMSAPLGQGKSNS
ncbi:hypothetical protein PCCS19_33850 [Paenibacillus sp. CCS19]|uniref:hypothetical protein n=1 Tax=Paenibacillus sp. CCS19 TaxID=3158387 RepID=UPI00256E40C4|nr:hypothetical protein [Paenibacillus cellulosilyticus]GMK40329.1 hypothetical protein PCCS19_33850 [Paenibacillus cellulosilyticus]